LIPGTSEEEGEMHPYEKANHGKKWNNFNKRKWKDQDSSHHQRHYDISNPVAGDPPRTIRNYIENITIRALRNGMETLDPSIFESNTDGTSRDRPVPVTVHTSEATSHRSQKYILIVAHTSTGFRIGHDALIGFNGDRGRGHATKANKNRGGIRKQDHREVSAAFDFVNQCVRGFVEEISEKNHGFFEEGSMGKRSCLDVHMRDQVVVFEALGELSRQELADGQEEGQSEEQEDESHWSLHTKTAQWVCRQMLGESVLR
jgi:RNA 3'-terminal phosphate cyclase (ATP)